MGWKLEGYSRYNTCKSRTRNGRTGRTSKSNEQRRMRLRVAQKLNEKSKSAIPSIRLHQELGHNEERDALHPGRRALDPREHQVHNVLGNVCINGGERKETQTELWTTIMQPTPGILKRKACQAAAGKSHAKSSPSKGQAT